MKSSFYNPQPRVLAYQQSLPLNEMSKRSGHHSHHRSAHHHRHAGPKMHHKKHHRHGAGFWDKMTKAAASHMTPENARRAFDLAQQHVVPEKYKKYTNAASQAAKMFGYGRSGGGCYGGVGVGGGRSGGKKKISKYNLLVSAVARDKFAGQPRAAVDAAKYIKAHGLYKK